MEKEKKICFIAPAFNEVKYNRSLIDSLLNQDSDQWKCIIYHNGRNSEMKEWVAGYNDSRLLYLESVTNTEMWGCQNRIDALYNHVDTEYVIQTSIQDYYVKNAVKMILGRMMNEKADICYWNSVYPQRQLEIFDTDITVSKIDWGNFCMPTDIARRIGIPEPDKITADGITVEKGIREGHFVERSKIDRVLTIKN